MVKTVDPDGAFKVTRSDIFGGKIIPFVPLAGIREIELHTAVQQNVTADA